MRTLEVRYVCFEDIGGKRQRLAESSALRCGRLKGTHSVEILSDIVYAPVIKARTETCAAEKYETHPQ